MAVLINKKGKLKLLKSQKILTGPQRIAQIVHCQEQNSDQRHVLFANTHLSFPGGPDDLKNARKQAYEVMVVARTLEKEGMTYFSSGTQKKHTNKSAKTLLQIIGGDFNSNSCGMAAQKLTNRFRYVNCACATAEQTMCSGSGGRVNLGVTHRTHLGEDVSVDHIFARLISSSNKTSEAKNSYNGTDISSSPVLDHLHLRNLGYLPHGVQVVNTRRQYLQFDGESIISDHRPVTAELKWPTKKETIQKKNNLSMEGMEFMLMNTSDIPLDPLQPPWPMS